MSDYNIINISKVNNNQLSDFYKKVFSERYKTLINHWKWWYRNNYLGFESLALIKDKKVIGQAGLIPVKIEVKDKILPAIWFVDFAVLPEYHGKGYGKILTKEWMKICPNQITFCNKTSLKIFKSFGWKENYSVKRLAKPINPIKFLPLLKKFNNNFVSSIYKNFLRKNIKNVNSIKPYSISNNYKILFESFNKKQKKNSIILRDQDWLNWRVMECPFRNNIYFFEYEENFAVTHILVNKNIKRLHILYSYYLDQSKEENLIRLIYKWAIDNSFDLIWANSNNKELIKSYEKVFSNKFSKTLNFASWSSNDEVNQKLQFDSDDLQAIDSDNDTILLDDNYL